MVKSLDLMQSCGIVTQLGGEMVKQPESHKYTAVTRRLRLNGQSTSIRLEYAFWDCLDRMAEARGMTSPAFLSKMQAEILEQQGEMHNFTSILRCACVVFQDEQIKGC